MTIQELRRQYIQKEKEFMELFEEEAKILQNGKGPNLIEKFPPIARELEKIRSKQLEIRKEQDEIHKRMASA